jgi:hypothetical protein
MPEEGGESSPRPEEGNLSSCTPTVMPQPRRRPSRASTQETTTEAATKLGNAGTEAAAPPEASTRLNKKMTPNQKTFKKKTPNHKNGLMMVSELLCLVHNVIKWTGITHSKATQSKTCHGSLVAERSLRKREVASSATRSGAPSP